MPRRNWFPLLTARQVPGSASISLVNWVQSCAGACGVQYHNCAWIHAPGFSLGNSLLSNALTAVSSQQVAHPCCFCPPLWAYGAAVGEPFTFFVGM